MNLSDLSTQQAIAIGVFVLLVLGGFVVWMLERRRTKRLRAQFGPEYERAVAQGGDRRRAEDKLAKRAERVQSFHLRPLTSGDRQRFTEAWARVQAHFVDGPAVAVAEADQLLGDVMATCGYPVGDFEQRAADISVEHPEVTQNYRAAHEIAVRQVRGQAGTEDLRRAMIHYRALFVDMVGETNAIDRAAVAGSPLEYDATASVGARNR